MRNAISEAISIRYGADWPLNAHFQNSLPSYDKKILLDAIKKKYQGVDKLLPEIKFVWFENMFTQRHDGRIWGKSIAKIFPNAPVPYTFQGLREMLKDACYTIRLFRNRCGHHEPIFNNIELINIYPLISSSINCRCNETFLWLDKNQSVTKHLTSPVI
jgi:hypothetical protein